MFAPTIFGLECPRERGIFRHEAGDFSFLVRLYGSLFRFRWGEVSEAKERSE